MSDLDSRPLGEVIQIRKGKKPASVSPRKQNEAQRPYLLIDSFGGEYKSFTDDTSCPYAKADETLLVWDGERCGLTSAGHEGYIGSTLAAIESTTEDLHPNYLFHFLAGKQKEIRNSAEGTGVPHVSRRFLEDLEIALPPLPEQKKIAEILSGIDLLITENEKKIQKLKLTHASLSANIFQIKPEAEQLAVALGDIVELRHGYQFRTPDFAQYGAKVIKISQVIGDGAVLTDNCDRVPWELAADKEKFRLRPGDVLMSLTGNIGRVGIVPETDEVLLQNYRVGLFSPIDARISREYMIHLLESRQVVSQLEDNANASAQANFGKGDLDKIMVYPPELQTQERSASLLSSSKNLIKAEKRKIEALRKTKLSVSADLLSGRKRVSI